MNASPRALATLALALGLASLALLAAGCETLTATTLEENQGAYLDARDFLQVGRTTRDEVAEKYGKPGKVTPLEGGGEHWEYRRRETVVMNAYTQTPLGTERSMMYDLGGYQHTIDRTTTLEVFFNAEGLVAHYRIDRGLK